MRCIRRNATGRLQSALTLTVLVLGCGGSGGGGDGGVAGASGGVAGSAGPGTGGIGAAGANGGTAGASGAGGGTAGAGAGGTGGGASGSTGACNTLTVSGNPIMQMAATGAAPTPTGGTIVDGTYALTRYDVYPPASPSLSPYRATYRITGNQVEVASGGGTIISNLNYTATTTGASWNLTGTCPVSPQTSIPYTATATTLLVFDGAGYLQVLTRQ